MPLEVTVSSSDSVYKNLPYLHKLLKTDQQATITAISTAIPVAIKLAEALKREKKGLHQQNTFEQFPNTTKVKVSILLSLNPLDSSHTGYQPPIPDSEVKEKSFPNTKKPASNPKPVQLNPSPLDNPSSSPTKRHDPKNRVVRETPKKKGGVREDTKQRFFSDFEKKTKENKENSHSNVPGMDKYRKVLEREKISKLNNEIYVSVGKKFSSDAKEVFKKLEEEKNEDVRLKAFGTAVAKAVKLAEWVNKVKKGLELDCHYSKKIFKDRYVPIEEGLDEVVKEKTLDTVEIVLRKVKAD